MSKSNWKGSGGWGAEEDYTNILENNVMKLVPGEGDFAEDYILQKIGTSVGLTHVHLGIRFTYAWDTVFESEDTEFGAVLRAHNFTAGTTFASVASNAYVGRINKKTKTATIGKRVNSSFVTLYSKFVGNNIFLDGTRNTFEFKCYGSTPELELIINDSVILAMTDSAPEPFNSGYPGLQCVAGNVYVTSVILLEYTPTGTIS